MRRLILLASLALLLGTSTSVTAHEGNGSIPTYSFKLVKMYPHDPAAFTQGLIYHDGFLYEGTGLNGRSEIRKVDLQTGKVLQRQPIPPEYFGEGITLFGGKIYQLTWTSKKGFIYDLATFKQTGSFSYATEGWGLTHDGSQLIMSDGTDRLFFLDPKTLKPVRTVKVTAGGEPVTRLNELEYIQGLIYANVWQTNRIAIINPKDGHVEAWLDLSRLAMLITKADVLNGIAYDEQGKRLFVTGKLWPYLFEIELVK
ncbi:glutaminyl-peptide cyclotransferase [Calidithermus roseus]|uniref:Glutamine cyclotransferase n=1 Tax=Calidithermus roseus TaxID=1644118 RepID=A0A399ETZ2_9DEIN|nr:glutaminyl-peptide cyclotransferase [Calidithermus roseus]RIH86559.1 Glutamine cyclotransferase [Calidithermus roseus]